MSPEQVAGSTQIGPPTDIWALGVVAYECLTGQVPFGGSKMSDLFESINLARHTRGSLLVPELGDAFDQWFARVCALEPSKRFESPVLAVNELARALGQPLPHESGPLVRGPLSSVPNAAAVTPMPRLTPPPGGATLDEEGSEPTLRREPSGAPPGGLPDTLSGRAPGSGSLAPAPRSRTFALGGVLVGVALMWLWSALREKHPVEVPPAAAPVSTPVEVKPQPVEVQPAPPPEKIDKPVVVEPPKPPPVAHRKVVAAKPSEPAKTEPPPAPKPAEPKKKPAGTTIDSTPELGI
jgi:serine/threonine-protein kinase